MKSSWESAQVDGSEMKQYVCVPDGTGPFPAVVVIMHRGGVDEFVQEMARRLATTGYLAAAPDLFHRDGPDCKDEGSVRMTRLRDVSVIKDVNATVDFLRSHSNVRADSIGIVGFCMGGRVVYLMAAANPHFKAAVAYYPGNSFSPWGDGPSPFDRTKEIHCPLLGHFGADDRSPSPDDMRKLDAELGKHGKVHEFYSYSNAGHAFMNFPSKSYRPHANRASWPRTLGGFLNAGTPC